jgi:hypothetical protein
MIISVYAEGGRKGVVTQVGFGSQKCRLLEADHRCYLYLRTNDHIACHTVRSDSTNLKEAEIVLKLCTTCITPFESWDIL